MNRQSPVRVILNLVLIGIVIISVVATGLISIKGYRSNRIPEIYSDKQITKVVKEEYSDFEFSKSDEWNIETQLANDNKSFTADVEIIKGKELCNAHYGVQLTFNLVKGSWERENLPSEMALTNNEWLFKDTDWTITDEDGITYELSFMADLEAKLSIQDSESDSSSDSSAENTSVNVLEGETSDEEIKIDDKDEAIVDEEDDENEDDSYYDADEDQIDGNINEISIETEQENSMFTCVLSESEDGTYFQGTFEVSMGESIMLTVTGDAVKIQMSGESQELILKKK